jgi:hypothetical protein
MMMMMMMMIICCLSSMELVKKRQASAEKSILPVKFSMAERCGVQSWSMACGVIRLELPRLDATVAPSGCHH